MRAAAYYLGTICVAVVAGGFFTPVKVVAQDGILPSIAQREISRRQMLVAEAETRAANGDTLLAEDNLTGAFAQYRDAYMILPDAPMTEAQRKSLAKRWADTAVLLGSRWADVGRIEESRTILLEVTAANVAPKHSGANKLLKRLDDPAWFNPAMTPSHARRVELVGEGLQMAQDKHNLGDYDAAEDEYHRVLNLDKYNTGARRGMEDIERTKIKHFDSAYDQTRSTFIRQVLAAWESNVPEIGIEGTVEGDDRPVLGAYDGVAYNRAKLRQIIIPSIQFQGTPLEDAIEFLRQKSAELDTMEPDPARKGVNIIIQAPGQDGGAGAGPADALGGLTTPAPATGGASPRITLNLTNVPLAEALRYTTELAGRKVKVESFAVKIVAQSDVSDELITKVFRVPPTFLSLGGSGGGGAADDDPFATPSDEGGSDLVAKPTALEVLKEKGISFPPGSSAFFNPASSQLIVRNTQSAMELIDTFVESIGEDVQKQITIRTKFVEVNENDLKELSFDWLIGGFGAGNDLAISGGTEGSTRMGTVTGNNFPIVNPATGVPIGQNISTSPLRTGNLAIGSNSIDSAILNSVFGQAVPFPGGGVGDIPAPAVFSFAGVLTDPQFQVAIRALNQKKGTDVLSAPMVTARSGQQARIEVIREFIYPTEYDPPELPNVVATGSGGTFPVTPANPTAFETRGTGVTLEVDPVIGADGFTIDLNLVPEVTEFDGFVNYGSPITAGTVTLTSNRIVMPIFSSRKATTAVTIWDGQTVVVGGLIREDIQNIEDKVPIAGDVPVIGRLFRSKVDQRIRLNLTIFATANLIDPAGSRIRKFKPLSPSETKATAQQQTGGNPLFPQTP